jgi:Ca2+-binding EF-hand superfamily protein
MRVKGGTPFSILRQMFLYWDRERTGKINDRDLLNCMSSLGVRIKIEEARAVIKYYDSKSADSNGGSMSYEDLLVDVQNGEPGLLEFLPNDTFEEPKSRFEFESEKYANKPPLVQKFIQAIRYFIMKRILRDGGTPFSIVRQIFMFYDINLSSALNEYELKMAMKKGMGLVFSDAHCSEILRFYNRDGSGEFGYQILLKDLTENFPSMLDFSGTGSFLNTKGAASNPFLPKDFELKDNKTIEMFQKRISASVLRILATRGGSFKSVLTEAFTFWDGRCIGKLKDPAHVVGALSRVGINASPDEVHLLMCRYNKDRDGEMCYNLFVDEMTKEEKNFLATQATTPPIAKRQISKSPAGVAHSSNLIKLKLQSFSTKTGGRLIPKDILHGTFLRFDLSRSGRVNLDGLRTLCKEIHADLSDAKLLALLSWFDSDGTGRMNYDAFVDELYGNKSTARNTRLFAKVESNIFPESTPPLLLKSYSIQLPKLKVDDEKRLTRLVQMKQEKALVKKKLASLDYQRKELEEAYKSR